jgi:hypothetical protein
MQSWQADWDEFNQRRPQPRQEAEVQQSRIQHLEHSLARLQRRWSSSSRSARRRGPTMRLERWSQLRRRTGPRRSWQARSEAGILEAEVSAGRAERASSRRRSTRCARRLQTWRGRQASLEALQQAARERADGGGSATGCAAGARWAAASARRACRWSRAGSAPWSRSRQRAAGRVRGRARRLMPMRWPRSAGGELALLEGLGSRRTSRRIPGGAAGAHGDRRAPGCWRLFCAVLRRGGGCSAAPQPGAR